VSDNYVVVGGPDGRWVGPLGHRIRTLLSSPFVSQKLVVCMTRRRPEDLTILRELMESGKVTPVIDRRYSLSEVPEAIRYLEDGHVRGKVVIHMGSHD
jgi:NADPH:quinone reductase-like Zn-dependent oxidoreductase